MLRHTMTTLAAVALTSAIAVGQTAQAPVPSKPAETPAAAQPPRPPAQLVNVRLDLTVTEQRGGTTLEPKTVTMLIADRENGRVRTGGGNALLNVDARPELTRDGRVRLVLLAGVSPSGGGDGKDAAGSPEPEHGDDHGRREGDRRVAIGRSNGGTHDGTRRGEGYDFEVAATFRASSASPALLLAA